MIAVAVLLPAIAAVSLLAPWDPVYDPWGWLVWGGEVGALDLDTSSGPSWKPLPVLFTTAFSLVPGAAPDLWLLVARTGWLAAVALGALLAARFAERAGAGRPERAGAALVAGLGIVLLADDFTPWLRQFAGGLSEPLQVALVLGAVERGLAERPRAALALGTAAALIRPEAWPFLVVYAAWLWRREPGERPAVGLALGAVAVLWFVPDLLGSGSFLTGADRAREGSGTPLVEAAEVLGRAAVLPLAALWAGAAGALVLAWRRGDRPLVAVALGALAWIALVAAMAAGGYAGLPRFVAPAAGVVCALGGAGIARLATAALARPRPALAAAAAAAALALLVQAGFRAAALGDAVAAATQISEGRAALAGAVTAAGPARVRACDEIVVGAIEGQTALAWLLDVPIARVDVDRTPAPSAAFFERTDGGWRAAGDCPPEPPASAAP